jgi:ankyrin repeat protein
MKILRLRLLLKRLVAVLFFMFFGLSASYAGDNQELLKAAGNGNVVQVKNLLSKISDINADTDAGSALAVASFTGNTEIVKILLDKGVNVNAKSPAGKAAVDVASSFYRPLKYSSVAVEIAEAAFSTPEAY